MNFWGDNLFRDTGTQTHVHVLRYIMACMTFANTCTYKRTNLYVYRSDLVVFIPGLYLIIKCIGQWCLGTSVPGSAVPRHECPGG